eukprot:CAMPEP_0178829220 /NCGR_PEP_ID=MMETSP0746-20121128/8253_1 /TAXON_ID=913974 /ORGANISM="Nitzschia punctata, Strain CCMP561" /LENGTH=138 /DNA_ID=CAMNT_0020491265 /DNA_START=153 /DNA_END=566 /DNA_ORIENTATION=+
MMDLLGYLKEGKENLAMFQLWPCGGVMKNAVLEEQDGLCFRTEYMLQLTNSSMTGKKQKRRIRGEDMWNALVQAKEKGFLFARKFRSDYPRSMKLLERIQTELHRNTSGSSLVVLGENNDDVPLTSQITYKEVSDNET